MMKTIIVMGMALVCLSMVCYKKAGTTYKPVQQKMVLVGLLAFLISMFCYQIAYGKNELLYEPLHSKQYNSGFSYGFFGVKLQEPHTKAYLYGYGNGTSAFQLDKGFADGSAGFPKSLNTSGYLDAYDFGVQNRVTVNTTNDLDRYTPNPCS